jgi:FkbM family methyltransferase
MSDFLNTLSQIINCDGVGPVRGVVGHLHWQLRRLFNAFPCELPIGESRLYVDKPGGVAALVNAMGEYDYNNMRLLSLVLSQRPATFIDVGANIGSYTLIASQVAGTLVVSIEPHPVTFAALKENVRVNGRTNVRCLNIAVSREDSEIRLSDERESSLNRVLEDDEGVDRHLRVPSRQLQTISRELSVVPNVIKIDVEGHERAVLDGLGELNKIPQMIFVEGGERPEILAWMRGSEYLGPWFAHFKERVLSTVRQKRAEDPIFISKGFLMELRGLGFTFASETIQL